MSFWSASTGWKARSCGSPTPGRRGFGGGEPGPSGDPMICTLQADRQDWRRMPRRGIVPAMVLLALALGAAGARAEVGIFIAPQAPALPKGAYWDFRALVTGTKQKQVKWSVCDGNGQNCVKGGNTTLGEIRPITTDKFANSIGQLRAAGAGLDPSTCAAPVPDGCQIKLKARHVDTGKTAFATVTIVMGLRIVTTALPPGSLGHEYYWPLTAWNGTEPLNWIVISGAVPDGLFLDTAGRFNGTPTAEGTFSFTVQVTDVASPPRTDTQDFSITIRATLGRNDSIGTASLLVGGISNISISPYADPVDADPANPDTDYFKVTGTAGTLFTVEVTSYLAAFDAAVEIVNADGVPFATCRNLCRKIEENGERDRTADRFDDLSFNEDVEPGSSALGSWLEFLVPRTPGAPVTFYVHV